jgi:hypothetical protein
MRVQQASTQKGQLPQQQQQQQAAPSQSKGQGKGEQYQDPTLEPRRLFDSNAQFGHIQRQIQEQKQREQ